jgi:hypothetical protein
MSDNPDISANIKLDISEYSRNVKRAARDADEVDAALDAIVDSANRAEKSLNELSGDIDVKLDTDFSSLLDADKTLQSLDTTITPLVDVQVANDASVRSLLDDFNSTLTTKINVEDSELKDSQQLLNRLDGETVDTKINAETGALEDVEKKLNDLRTLAVIDISMNLVGMIPTPADIPLLGAIIEADVAARSLVAKLGEAGSTNTALYTAGAQDVYKSNFGESQQDAADKYAEVVRITKNDTGELTKTSESFAQVTKDGFVVAAVSGEDFNKVIRAADTLVQTGLAPSYEEAFDQITTGFQNGLNKGEDFLDTIVEYSGQFEQLGFTAEEFFSTLKGGLDAGAFNTDFIADLIKEMNIRAQAAMAGEGAEFDALKSLGLLDEAKAFQAGEITGAEYMSGIIGKLKADTEAGTLNPTDFFSVLGTKAEDLTLPVVLELDPKQIQEALQNVEGATLEASVLLGGDLSSTLAGLQRTIETDLAASVSKAFDIPGKIQQLSDGVSKFSSLLGEGFTVPEAIEVAFQIPGFAETVATLESALGNLGITILEVAANILQGVGQGEAAAGIRTTVSDLATQQLAFDLKLADDGADFSRAITTAVNRGVEGSDLQAGILTAGREFIDEGELEKARSMVEALQQLSTAQADIQLTGGGLLGGIGLPDVAALKAANDAQSAASAALAPMNTALVTAETAAREAEQAFTTHLDTMRASAESKLPGIAEIATSSLAPVEAQIGLLSGGFEQVDTSFATTNTNMATNAAVMSTTISGVNTEVDTFASNTAFQFAETLLLAAESGSANMNMFGENMSIMLLDVGAKVNDLIDTILTIGNLDVGLPTIGGGGGGGGGQIPGEATGGLIPAGEVHRVHGGESLIAGNQDISVLNRQTSSVIDNAVAGYMAAAGMSGGGNVTNNYVTNNVVVNTSGAAATTAAMDSKVIRGF